MKSIKLKNKNLNAKNFALILENLILQEQPSSGLSATFSKGEGISANILAFLNTKEIESFLPQVLKILKRKLKASELWNLTQIISKTNLTEETLNLLTEKYDLNKNNLQVKLDDKMSAGVIIKNGSQYIDATLSNYLNKVIK
jgi:F0F1-type ATP synthase delta subunit